MAGTAFVSRETLIYSIRAAQVRVSNTSMSVRRLAGHVSGYVLGGFETRTYDAGTLRNCSAFPWCGTTRQHTGKMFKLFGNRYRPVDVQ